MVENCFLKSSHNILYVYFQAVAIGIEDLPPEMIGEIMSYCDTDDKKEMRCVSKW